MHNNLLQAKNIIDYWSWVEHFTPPTLFDNDSAIKTVLGDQEIPWLNPDYSEDETHTWLYSVYVGVINCKNIIEKLKAELGSELIDSNSKNEKSESYLFCFEVDVNGHPIGDSIAIPDYVASMGCLIKVRHLTPDIWLDNFDPIKTKIEEMLKNIFCNLRQADTQIPLNFTLFEQMVSAVKQITEWNELLSDVKNQVRIDIRKITKPKNIHDNSIEEIESESENESLKLFNSFFFKDLKSISDGMKRDEPLGKVLSEYLNIVPCPPKADIRKDKTLLQTLLSPNNLAVARWPGKGDHPLVLGQQLAVNTLFNSKTEMFSVNGSPGTGKTTLLWDVIANIIVLRAQKLAALNSPDDAYTGSENVCIANYNYKIWKLNEELLGHGIVISSPNNAAIKNITTEIPLAGAIDDKWEADYFSEVASHIFGKKCWGLTAAPLGSSKNVKEFFNAFWPIHPKDKTFNKLLLDNNADFEDWQQAKENFLACIKSFNSIQNELNNIEKILKEKAQILDCLNTIELECNNLTKKIEPLEENKQKISFKILELENKISEKEKAKALLEKIKPSFIRRILNFFFDRKRNSEWDTKYNQRVETLIQLSDEKEELTTALSKNAQKLKRLSNDLRLREAEKQNILEEFNKINNSLFSAKEIIGDNFPDDEYWALEDEKLQKTSPWNFSDLHEIRAKIFIEALNLHKIFILYNREKIANTLRAARQVIAEGKLPYDKMHLIPHIWETFHLTVPVVSTTFASFSKLFKGMGNNTIGWLLIDEAGQAMPQITAGALFRAKRAMIVGDPLQIEPVVTIPEVMSLILRKYFKVSNSWDPYNQSVQTLADRANPIGTVLQSGEKENSHWLGAPLRVHRRCNDPMFTLSNSIVYDNLMIYASNNKPLQVDLKLSDSLWAHVTSNGESKNNWSKPEGEVAFDFLKHINKLNDKVINLRSTFVISPFKNMKQGFRKLLNEDLAYKKLFNNKVEFNRWMKTNVGTTHTFQGKEAEIVIFILGSSSKRALQWASKNPNLLNVALTRAKRAIYIIGDFHIWSKMNYFNQLAGNLPIKPYNEKLLPYKKGGQSS